jgi:2-dehydro-3-deoxyphosphogalactonate aldolase
MKGLVAILRGITPDEVAAVADVLVDSGIRTIEVPLNSPAALQSIERLSARLGSAVLVGAGTVLGAAQVDQVAQAGARLVLSPHFDAAVVARTRQLGLCSMPGVFTPSEGFAALAAGAQALKLFPAEQLGPGGLRAWRTVFPPDTPIFAVGGVGPGNLKAFRDAGATGAGIGGALYAPGVSLPALAQRAKALVQAWSDGG